MNGTRIDQLRRSAAQDSKRLVRYFRVTVDASTNATQRADGSWEFDGVATRGDAVFDYSTDAGQEWKEFRPLDEVFSPNSIASLEGAAITDDHPANFVDIYNARELGRGHVMKAWQDGNLMRVRVLVRDAELLQKIRDGKVELSCGYSAVVVPGDGVHPTEGPYQAKQTQIVHNHLAVVDAARAGPVARLAVPPMPPPAAPGADSKGKPAAGDSKGKRDTMDKIVINGVEWPVDPAATSIPGPVGEYINSLTTQLTTQATQIAELQKASGTGQPAGAGAAGGAPPPNQPAAGGAPAGDGKGKDKDKNPDDKDKDGAGGKGDSKMTMDEASIQKIVDDRMKANQADADTRAKHVADAMHFLPAGYDITGKPTARILADALTAFDKDYKAKADAMATANNVAGLAAVLEVRLADAGRVFTARTGKLLGDAGADKTIDRAGAARQRMNDKRQGKVTPAPQQPQLAAGGANKP